MKYTLGVYGFVNFAGKPIVVPDDLVAKLTQFDSQTIDTVLRAGDEVTINDDQYKNVKAMFLEVEREKHSIFLIELHNK